MKLLKGKKGFTLIELVVVIAILGILAGIAIPRFLDATATARGAKIVADLRTIDSAIVIYNAKTGTFPKDFAALTTDNPTNATPQYKLLASEPKPAQGNAIFPAKPGKTSKAGDSYALSKTDGTENRATVTLTAVDGGPAGTLTADKLAEGGSGSAS